MINCLKARAFPSSHIRCSASVRLLPTRTRSHSAKAAMDSTGVFFLDAFAARQFDGKGTAGCSIDCDKEEFVDRCHKAHAAGAALVDGYAPFCKHIFIPNSVSVLRCWRLIMCTGWEKKRGAVQWGKTHSQINFDQCNTVSWCRSQRHWHSITSRAAYISYSCKCLLLCKCSDTKCRLHASPQTKKHVCSGCEGHSFMMCTHHGRLDLQCRLVPRSGRSQSQPPTSTCFVPGTPGGALRNFLC